MNRWAAVARFGGIGDNLVAGSPLAGLKRQGYMTEMITNDGNHVLYHHNPYVDKLSVKRPDKDFPKDLYEWQKHFEARAAEYDVFVHASHSMEGRHALFKTMTAFWWPRDYRRKMCAGSYLETVHDIAGVPYEFGPLFFPSPEEYAYAFLAKKGIGEKFLLWVISGTRVDKVYPYTTMAVSRIIKELGIPVVLMGGPSEKEHSMSMKVAEYVETANGSRDGLHLAVPPLEGGEKCWPLRTSLTFALVADLIVTPDTGVAWAVAFEQMPKIVMMSHASVENITKHWVNTTTLHADPERVPCWPCHRLHDDTSHCVENKEKNGAACISDISVETVVNSVAKAWRGNASVIHAEQVFKVARRSEPEGWKVPGREHFS